MPPSFNSYLDRFATIFFLIFLGVALWLFWSSLFVVIVPDLALPFVTEDSIKQKINILTTLLLVISCVDYFARRFFGKIDFGWVGIILFGVMATESIAKIFPELLQGNSFISIINTYPSLSDDIITIVFIVMLFGITGLFIFLDKKINNN